MSNVVHYVFIAVVAALALCAFATVFDGRRQPVRTLSAEMLQRRVGNPQRRNGRSDPAEASRGKALVVSKAARVPAPQTALNYVALDLAGAVNANFLADIKRSSRGPEGLPEDGRVPIPGVVPRAFFHIGDSETENAILKREVSLELPAKQRGHYQQIAVLHGAPINGGPARLTLHYEAGDEQVFQLQVLNWNPRNRREKPVPQQFTAVQTLGADGKINAELFSQTFDIDETRVLQSVAMEFDSDAAVFGVTLILPE